MSDDMDQNARRDERGIEYGAAVAKQTDLRAELVRIGHTLQYQGGSVGEADPLDIVVIARALDAIAAKLRTISVELHGATALVGARIAEKARDRSHGI